MDALRKAAEQALAALERIAVLVPRDDPQASEAITALRAELAKPEQERTCTYTVKEKDGFGTLWTTGCRGRLYVAAPVEVGLSFAPMPNEDGKFCSFCGGVIVLGGDK